MARFSVAAVHAAPVFLDVDATIPKACDLSREADDADVQLLVFPEVFVPGFPYWINCDVRLAQVGMHVRYGAASIEVPGPEIDRVRAAARRRHHGGARHQRA
jgi:nitrilase